MAHRGTFAQDSLSKCLDGVHESHDVHAREDIAEDGVFAFEHAEQGPSKRVPSAPARVDAEPGGGRGASVTVTGKIGGRSLKHGHSNIRALTEHQRIWPPSALRRRRPMLTGRFRRGLGPPPPTRCGDDHRYISSDHSTVSPTVYGTFQVRSVGIGFVTHLKFPSNVGTLRIRRLSTGKHIGYCHVASTILTTSPWPVDTRVSSSPTKQSAEHLSVS
ncbi:hypothetical protein C8R47DRAFT_1196653 [Mycena vitilis]|nr:hypothetical protein C8R47DRAFT_1196653 [Mycena vitilis]